MNQITLQTGPERRRHWSAAAQREILSAAFMPGAVATEVARRYDVSTSLIYKWRQQARSGETSQTGSKDGSASTGSSKAKTLRGSTV
ncbi:transposase [Lichenifustis flavocetrariae]|uniref:Transposase n=1 Tax=Lichenifustis flavocetrariae TaxID=2949735 RepID=A0AA42CMZ2_9HYPH|nr:transposase [Lichenifustis flavocetrariae]MCW6513008.1 transposase [Lichenifustis flavocetrariae]